MPIVWYSRRFGNPTLLITQRVSDYTSSTVVDRIAFDLSRHVMSLISHKCILHIVTCGLLRLEPPPAHIIAN